MHGTQRDDSMSDGWLCGTRLVDMCLPVARCEETRELHGCPAFEPLEVVVFFGTYPADLHSSGGRSGGYSHLERTRRARWLAVCISLIPDAIATASPAGRSATTTSGPLFITFDLSGSAGYEWSEAIKRRGVLWKYLLARPTARLHLLALAAGLRLPRITIPVHTISHRGSAAASNVEGSRCMRRSKWKLAMM